MDALREAQVPSAPSADPTSQPRREKKKRGSRAKGTASPPTPPGLSIDGTEAAAKAQASSEAKDQSDSSGDAVDLPKKPSRARAKAEPIFTPFEVEEAEVIIIRRR